MFGTVFGVKQPSRPDSAGCDIAQENVLMPTFSFSARSTSPPYQYMVQHAALDDSAMDPSIETSPQYKRWKFLASRAPPLTGYAREEVWQVSDFGTGI